MKESFPIIYLTRTNITNMFGSKVANKLTDDQMQQLVGVMKHKCNGYISGFEFHDMLAELESDIEEMIGVHKPKYIMSCPKCEGADIYTIGTIDYLKLDNEGNLERKYTTGPTSEERVYKCNKCGYSSECIDCFIKESD